MHQKVKMFNIKQTKNCINSANSYGRTMNSEFV